MRLSRQSKIPLLLGSLSSLILLACESSNSSVPLALVTTDQTPTPMMPQVTPVPTTGQSPLPQLPPPLPTPNIVASAEPSIPLVEPVSFVPAIRASIFWQSVDDLDLFVVDPTGARVFFGNRNIPSGGTLAIDANAACANTVTQAVEDIFFPPNALPGNYIVGVNLFQRCEGGVPAPTPIPFRLVIEIRGEVRVFEASVVSGADFTQTFVVPADSGT